MPVVTISCGYHDIEVKYSRIHTLNKNSSERSRILSIGKDYYFTPGILGMIISIYLSVFLRSIQRATLFKYSKEKHPPASKRKPKNFLMEHSGERGYFVSTVGINEQAVKKYVENQSHHQVTFEQQKLPLA
jgi:REP element-mobilizing transposase RayT